MSAAEGDVWIGVRRILSELLDRPGGTITPAMRLADDLGMKTIDLADLMLAIEEDFGIVAFTRPFSEVRTVGDVAVYVEETLRTPYPSADEARAQVLGALDRVVRTPYPRAEEAA